MQLCTWQMEASVSAASVNIRKTLLFQLYFQTEGRLRSSETVGLLVGSGFSIICSTDWSSRDRPAKKKMEFLKTKITGYKCLWSVIGWLLLLLVNSDGRQPCLSCCQPSPPLGTSMLQASSRIVTPKLNLKKSISVSFRTSSISCTFQNAINFLTYLKTSAAGPYSPRSSSGAMYLGSPSCMSSFPFPSIGSPLVCFSSRSSPKSPSLRRPEAVMRTLAGFKSRCTNPRECKCSSADRRSHR